ncbi:MAG: thiol peroxidase [Duncaniella sp.]|nr:thiol peroxidase [Duncaniella sp.]
METVFFNGTPMHTCGIVPSVGEIAPCFHLTGRDLSQMSCSDFAGRRVVLNIFPSLDTEVCARSVRRFNEEASKLDSVTVICVSMDLPFAMSRFCTIEGIDNVSFGSAFRSPLFGQKYGLQLVDGPLAGLLTRAVIILDDNRRVIFRDIVREITNEPDYEAALKALRGEVSE